MLGLQHSVTSRAAMKNVNVHHREQTDLRSYVEKAKAQAHDDI